MRHWVMMMPHQQPFFYDSTTIIAGRHAMIHNRYVVLTSTRYMDDDDVILRKTMDHDHAIMSTVMDDDAILTDMREDDDAMLTKYDHDVTLTTIHHDDG